MFADDDDDLPMHEATPEEEDETDSDVLEGLICADCGVQFVEAHEEEVLCKKCYTAAKARGDDLTDVKEAIYEEVA